MNAFKRRCIELRRQDYTLTEIVNITGRPKTSVYAHIHKIPLSEKKRLASLRAQGIRIRKYALMRRGISQKKFKRFTKWDKSIVRFISHFLFDGEIKHGHCSYHNRNTVLIRGVENDVAHVYEFKPRRYHNWTTGVSRISYFNVAFSAYIKEKAEKLISEIPTLGEELQREFLGAFFDDEGCMDFRPARNVRQIRGYQKKVDTLYLIQKLLGNLGITADVKYPNEVVIRGKENLKKFQEEIGFSPGVRINGNRSNSIWKKSLEKRVLLERAIASYKPVGSSGVHRTKGGLNR